MMKAIMRYLLSGLTLIWCWHLVAQSTTHDCNVGQLISIIGKNNYEKARRGQSVDPREFAENSQKAIVAMEKEVADVQKLLSALGVQSTAQAQATILGYQAQLEGSVGSHELEATIQSTAERIQEKKVLLQEMDKALKESDSTLQELEAKQKMPTQACDALYKSRTQEYAKVIGQQNSEAINAAVEQKIANPTIVQHPDQLLKLAFFPTDSSVALQVKKAKEELDQQVRAAKEKLEKLNQALRAKRERSVMSEPPQTPAVVPASLPIPPNIPNSSVVMPMLPEPSPASTPIPPAPPLPKPATHQEPAKQEPILVSPVAAPTSTPSATSDCEKKLIKIRMALNYHYANHPGMRPSEWAQYVTSVIKNETWSEDVKKKLNLNDSKIAELDTFPDCDKKVGKIQMLVKYYHDVYLEEKSSYSGKKLHEADAFFSTYISPIMRGEEWYTGTGILGATFGAFGHKLKSSYDIIKDFNLQALSDPSKNTFGITKEEYETIFGKQ